MKNSIHTSVPILFTMLIVAGCSEDSNVATKNDKSLKTIVATATSDCHLLVELGAKQNCLQAVKDSPEYIELIRRSDEKSSPYDTPLSGTRGNALDW